MFLKKRDIDMHIRGLILYDDIKRFTGGILRAAGSAYDVSEVKASG